MLDIIIAEERPKPMRGEWQDVFMEVNKGKIVDIQTMQANEFEVDKVILDEWGRPWAKNTIMDINSALLCALYATLGGYDGLTYMALGQGDSAWDTAPIPAVDTSDDTLLSEFFRKALDSVIFLDSGNNPVTFDDTVRRIESSCTYLEGEANGSPIREFSLFGGDATVASDSGLISNVIRHQAIYKNSTLRFLRRVRYIIG